LRACPSCDAISSTPCAGQFNYREVLLAHFHINQPIIELAASQLSPQFLASALKLIIARGHIPVRWRRLFSFGKAARIKVIKTGSGSWRGKRMSRIRSSAFNSAFSAISEVFPAGHVNRDLGQVADHAFDIAANYPTSVNFEASTFRKGEFDIAGQSSAISVSRHRSSRS